MFEKIATIYQLMFNKFKFEVVNNNLKVYPPNNIDDITKKDAHDFISKHKKFITNIFTNNTNGSRILHIDSNENVFPLSGAQERLWFIEQFTNKTCAYNIPMVFKLKEGVNKQVIEKCIRSIIKKHEVLRTLIKEDASGNGYQIILGYSDDLLKIKEYTADEATLNNLINSEATKIFNLSENIPLRVSWYSVNEATYLSIVIHHIAYDGWSMDIFLYELQEAYKNCISNSTLFKVDNSYIQYKDYTIWQKNMLDNKQFDSQLDYWVKRLNGYEELSLSSKVRTIETSYDGDNIRFEFSSELSIKIRNLSTKINVSLYSILLSAFYLLLKTYSNQDDIIIGTPVANRHYPELDSTIGFFVNTLALRSTIDSSIPIIEFICSVNNNIIEAQKNQDIPFEKVVDALRKLYKIDIKNNLFQVMFGVQSFGSGATESWLFDNIMESYDSWGQINASKFDFSLFIDDSNESLQGNFNYATSLFTKENILNFINTYLVIIKDISSLITIENKVDFIKQVRNVSTINQEQYDIINKWNDTYKAVPEDATIPQLFEKQVAITPENVALIYKNYRLTYNELNKKVNQLAAFLVDQYNIQPNDIIALNLNRGYELIISILAVWKSGAAYVPIDPDYPLERKMQILENCSPKLLILNECYSNNLFSTGINNFSIDTKHAENILNNYKSSNIKLHATASSLAYIIYTSGTTGEPKGVMVEHKSAVNLKYALTERYQLGQNNTHEVILQFANYVFDPSVEQILLSLLNGFPLLLIPNKLWLSESDFLQYLRVNKVTHIHATPSFLEQYNFNALNSLKRIISAGERFSNNILCNETTIFNKYGPTEATISVTAGIVGGHNPSIGKIIPNAKLYILSPDMQLLPVYAVGELFIGGECLARGYFAAPLLTKEKFIDNPFQSKEERLSGRNSRLYRTGDLVKWLPDGDIEYIGRADDQVKIRGHRIELNEIISLLNNYMGIKQCTVVVSDQGLNKYILGYYTAESELNNEDIINYLSKKLPDYMVPKLIMRLDTIPLSVNGKVNKKVLPQPSIQPSNISVPTTDLENKVCSIWSKLLDIDTIGIDTNANFFDLGGNSLLIIRLKSTIEKEFKRKFNISDFFKFSSIRSFCEFIQNDTPNKISYSNMLSNLEDRRVAVIAMSGAFSGSDNLDEYWESIINGKESLLTLSKEECLELGIPDSLFMNKNYIPTGGVIKNIDKFDPDFWNLSPKDAMLFDPQIRKFLEHGWKALEHSGYIKSRSEKRIGVFAGMSNSKYYETRIQNNHELLSQASWEINTMNSSDFLATRLSYMLGLTGPSINVNTACSTSLVAIIEACKNLFLDSCDMALAGGASFSMPENHGYIYREGMILSKDGHCRTFDKNATGTVRGSGIGVVVLKRLQDAIQDKDNILAVIKGYSANNDGNRKVGFTAPSVAGQIECIREAQSMARISADQIGYIECHGTATILGDPIELAALHEAFTVNTSKNNSYDCVVGSVKANIGHANSASGVAGFIKICKMLQHRVIPPQINFQEVNPELNLNSTNFTIARGKKDWASNYTRKAGVSSFGVGGTNAHIILEEYISEAMLKVKSVDLATQFILPLSAKSASSLVMYANSLADYLESYPDVNLADIAYSLQERREVFAYRESICCSNTRDAINKLKSIVSSKYSTNVTKDIIFMFPGQGNQYINMGKELYQNEPIFKLYFDKCCNIISRFSDLDFKEIIYPAIETENSILNDTKWSQPALFIVCFSLTKLLESYDIYPIASIGHSLGEYVTATLSGVFSLEDALQIVIKRGELMQKMPTGSMVTVNASKSDIDDILFGSLSISVYNARKYIVVSGIEEDIDQFMRILSERHIFHTKLHTSHAFHSSMMKQASIEFEVYLSNISMNKPSKMFISNISGTFIDDISACSPSYWAKHICEPVKFSTGLEALFDKYKTAIYVEIGPGKSLSTFISQYNYDGIQIKTVRMLPTSKECNNYEMNAQDLFYSTIGNLWKYGYNVQWQKVRKVDTSQIIDIPTYQFQQNKLWVDLPMSNNSTQSNIIEDKVCIENINILTDDVYSEQENKIAQIFSEILGTTQFSKHDSYFKLGGNSLSALRLVSIFNKNLNVNLPVSVLMQHDTVYQISEYIGYANAKIRVNKDQHQIVNKLNSTDDKPIMFMIHPSQAGCEVYSYLAKIFDTHFSCYGIDSYNLYNDNKINDINKLSEFYLEHIGKLMEKHNRNEYHLFGWSLGGQIALQIAINLEAKGIKNISLYLLDTVLTDEYIKNSYKKVDFETYKEKYKTYALGKEYDSSYIDRVIKNIDTDHLLVTQKMYTKLIYSKVLLFKAMNSYNRFKIKTYDAIHDYIAKLEYNNIDLIIEEQKIKLLEVNDAHHWNIMEQEQLVKVEILKFNGFINSEQIN